jgi:hypothetical protein
MWYILKGLETTQEFEVKRVSTVSYTSSPLRHIKKVASTGRFERPVFSKRDQSLITTATEQRRAGLLSLVHRTTSEWSARSHDILGDGKRILMAHSLLM